MRLVRGGDGGDQDLRRGARLALGVMVFGAPVTIVAQRLAVLRQPDAFANGRIGRAAR